MALLDLFFEASNLYPSRVALKVISRDKLVTAASTVTYEELTNTGQNIAKNLRECFENERELSVLCIVKPSLALPAAILGILHSSNSFVCLDLRTPVKCFKRLEDILLIKFAIGEKRMVNHLIESYSLKWKILKELRIFNEDLVVLQVSQKESGLKEKKNGGRRLSRSEEIAYTVLTSGTTGSKKVVRVPHKCILPNVLHLRNIFEVKETDIIPLMAPLTFDPSVVDIFLALSSGATLLLVPETLKAAPKHLARALTSHKVTLMQVTPSILLRFGGPLLSQSLLSAESTLRVLALGGEPCPPASRLQSFMAKGNTTRLFSLYGTTEVSCWATIHELDSYSNLSPSVPLGKPLTETLLELRNITMREKLREGEIFIGSTTRICQIVPDDSSSPTELSDTVWRSTGDWATEVNGELFFLHRTDALTKHNGRKVDLAPIQEHVSRISGVQSCSLLYQNLEKYLAVFVVPEKADLVLHPQEIVQSIRLDCSKEIPLKVYLLPQLPVTKHGKIDKDQLFKFTENYFEVPERTFSSLAEVEDLIKRLWKVYSGSPCSCQNSHFLECGGDSVSSVQMASDVEWYLQRQLPQLVDKLLHGPFKDITRGSCIVCIGSHSGKFIVVNFASGSVHWKIQLPDRVESSACASSCGSRIYVGCYDHFLYCLNIESGDEHWRFQTQGEIKSSPVCHPNQDLVFVGSHDKHLYALHSLTGCCLWKAQVGSGSVFSSPALSFKLPTVFAASLDGTIAAFNVDSGEVSWRSFLDKPVFASPVILEEQGICVGSVSGEVAMFDFHGLKRWSFTADGPVFCSPSTMKTFILIGCHGHSVHCLHVETGLSLWRFKTDSPVYATPCPLPARGLVAVASTIGKLSLISALSGEELYVWKYPGDTFGSPVYHSGCLVVGCRDNYLYCHRLKCF